VSAVETNRSKTMQMRSIGGIAPALRGGAMSVVKHAGTGLLGIACLLGAAQPAAAVSPVFFNEDFFTNKPLVASRSGKFVGFVVRVNSIGVSVDAETVSRFTEFASEGVANCLGDPLGTVSYDIEGDSPLSLADDFNLVCPFSRGDEIFGAVAIVTDAN
jgi:hypothetical protein